MKGVAWREFSEWAEDAVPMAIMVDGPMGGLWGGMASMPPTIEFMMPVALGGTTLSSVVNVPDMPPTRRKAKYYYIGGFAECAVYSVCETEAIAPAWALRLWSIFNHAELEEE